MFEATTNSLSVSIALPGPISPSHEPGWLPFAGLRPAKARAYRSTARVHPRRQRIAVAFPTELVSGLKANGKPRGVMRAFVRDTIVLDAAMPLTLSRSGIL